MIEERLESKPRRTQRFTEGVIVAVVALSAMKSRSAESPQDGRDARARRRGLSGASPGRPRDLDALDSVDGEVRPRSCRGYHVHSGMPVFLETTSIMIRRGSGPRTAA